MVFFFSYADGVVQYVYQYILLEKVISNISQGRVIAVPFLYVFYYKSMQKKQSKCILTVVQNDRIDWWHESNYDKLLSYELSIIFNIFIATHSQQNE